MILLAALAVGCSPLLQEGETGLVPVSIRLAATGEEKDDTRTLMPAGTGAALFYDLRLNRGDLVVEETIDAGLTKTVSLGSGEWNLLVHGYGSAADRETGTDKAVLSGAGVYVHNGTFTLNSGGEISQNTASSHGGGVYIASSGAFTMNGGKISGNTASRGQGVYVDYFSGTFTMSGGARVDSGNHVLLGNLSATYRNASITIGGAFTGDPGPIATIDLDYGSIGDWLGKKVLLASPPGGAIDQSIIDRFPLGSVGIIPAPLTDYKIATDGTLAER